MKHMFVKKILIVVFFIFYKLTKQEFCFKRCSTLLFEKVL